MALQTKVLTSNGSKGHHRFTLNVYENSTDILNNKSNVSFSLVLSPIQAGWDWYNWGNYITYSVNIGGQVYNGTIPNYDGYSTITLRSQSLNITHNDDGKKTINVSFSVVDNTGQAYTCGNASSSTNFILTDIPRVSDIALEKDNINVGENLIINTTKKYEGFIDNLTIKFGEFEKVVENVGNVYEWLTEEDKEQLYSQMPNVNSLKGEVIVETFTDETSIGTKSIDFTLNVVNSNPQFTNFTYEDTNPKTLGLTGNNQTIIKNYSNVKGVVSLANKAVAINGATMKKYRFVVGEKQKEFNYSESEDVSATIEQVQNNMFVMYAIDSRNNSTMKQINAETYLDYFKPKILNFSLERTLGGVGEYVVLNVNGEFWNNSFGTETNGIVVTYKIKRTDSEEWIVGKSDIIPQIDGNNFNFSGEVAGDLENTGFDIESSYNIEITITDKLDSAKDTEIIGSGTPNMAMHANGTAFGGIYDEFIGGILQVAGQKMAEKVENELKIFASHNLAGQRLLVEGEGGGGSGIEEIIENENGTALKFSDGRLIQYGLQNKGSISFNTDYWGTFTRADNTDLLKVNFPIEFLELSYCDYVPKATNAIKVETKSIPTNTTFSPYIVVPKGNTGTRDVSIYFYAIGTWKELETGGGSSSGGNSGSNSGSSESVLDIYSYDEVKTNKIWVNGKPIYRKILETQTTQTDMAHNIANIDEITNVETLLKQPSGMYSKQDGSVTFINKTIYVVYGEASGVWKVLVEYTKTTD